MRQDRDSGSDDPNASRTNLAWGYRIGAYFIGVCGILAASILIMVKAVTEGLGMGMVGGAVLLLFAVAFLYIGITGDQDSWPTKVLRLIGAVMWLEWL